MNTKRFFLTGVVCLALATAAQADERSWTDVKGRKIEAELLREEGTFVVLAKGDKIMRIPVASLSEEDQAYLKRLREKNEIVAKPTDDDEENPFAGSTEGSLGSSPDSSLSTDRKKPTKEKSKDSTPAQVGLGEIRLWTMLDGKSMRAKFVQVKENMVILRMGIKNQSYLFVGMSLPDQEYVKGMLRARKQDAILERLETEIELAKRPTGSAGYPSSLGSTGTYGGGLAAGGIAGSSGTMGGSSYPGGLASSTPGSSLRGGPTLGSPSLGGLSSVGPGSLGSSNIPPGMPSTAPGMGLNGSGNFGSSNLPPGYGGSANSSQPASVNSYGSSGSYSPPQVIPGLAPVPTPVYPPMNANGTVGPGVQDGRPTARSANLFIELGITGYMLAGSFVALCIAVVATVLKIMVAPKQ